VTVLRLDKVGKQLQRHGSDRPRRLRELVSRAGGVDQAGETFWAVRSVSLEVRPGEMLGIIGGNGAGKSTLLRLCGGVIRTTEGVVQRTGRAEAFFDYTAGLQPDLTCQDNTILGLVISGYGRREAKSLLHEVLEFADLLEQRHSPVRVLSTGMKLRLGFAIATQRRPDLLLLDEVVSVGDAAFQERSSGRISAFRKAGMAAVLVSHDMDLIARMCERAVWLKHGQVAEYGESSRITEAYLADIAGSAGSTPSCDEPLESRNVRANVKATVNGVAEEAVVRYGETLNVTVQVEAAQPLGGIIPALMLVDESGQIQSYVHSELAFQDSSGRVTISAELGNLCLADGLYIIGFYLHSDDWSTTPVEQPHVARIRVESAPAGAGLLRLSHHWVVQSTS